MKKSGKYRLTITLRKDLLPLLDQSIDGAKIRNRSHAIEYLLDKSLGPKINQAVILAGGHGIKMRPFTYELPKTMILIKGKPILEYTINTLREQGIKDIIILVGHLSEKITEYFGDGARFGVKIKYVREKESAGTAVALKTILSVTGNNPFLLIYGDVLAEINYHDLINFHLSNNALATVALTTLENPAEYGVVKLHGNQIMDFIEKPDPRVETSRLISAGIYVIEPEITKYITKKTPASLEIDVLPHLAKDKKLFGYPFEGKWFDISTPEIYERALKQWKQ